MGAVTELPSDAADRSLVGDAVAAADAAAQAAGVRIGPLDSLADLQAVQQLYERIWRPGGENPPVTADLLRALTKAGNHVSGAFDGDELVGASVGFFGPPVSAELHSHIAGVSARMRGRNVGFALKVHQRAWALQRGVREISWTFDPLSRRNAYFNIGKLAADPAEYLSNFYGQMHDAINGSDDSDRLLVTWRLASPEVAAACSGGHRIVDAAAERAAGAVPALDVAPSRGPSAGHTDAATVLVAVPADIEAIRSEDEARAAAWRVAVREALGGLIAAGARVRGFDRAGWYVVDRKETP